MADNTLYLIDGMAFAFRAYYAIRTALTDTHGRPTNAIYGFTRVLLKLLREQDPSHIAVVFDAPGKTFRDDMYAAYKGTRRETPPDLVEQFPRMHEVVKAMNLPLLVISGVEADDVIGSLARRAAEVGMNTVIVSGDKDLLQLVTDKIAVFDPSKGDNGEWSRREQVVERFGVGPEYVVDALALIGDAADNIPGVRGIGDKTAKKLLEDFGSLEGLYARIDELKGKQKENLIADKDQAYFSRELATIKTDVECAITPKELLRVPPDREKMKPLFAELAFHSLLDEIAPETATAAISFDYKLIGTEAELQAALGEMRQAGIFSIDTETTSTDPMRAALVGISLSCKAGTGYYIPVSHTAEARYVLSDPDDLSSGREIPCVPKPRVLELMRPLLEDDAIGKLGHNIKYDMLIFAREGIEIAGLRMDTMVASYLTDPSRMRHNLDEVSLQYLRHKTIPISDLIGKGAAAVTFDHVPVDKACVYAAEDADIAWRLYEAFVPLLRERELEPLFQEVELPLIHVLARMERAGIAIDLAVFETMRKEIHLQLGELEKDIHRLAEGPFNIGSPKQLQTVLFDKLGLKPLRKTKTGYSTDESVLEELSAQHELPAKILAYRSLDKLRGTYVEALPKMVNPETGRIHTSFNQAVAATGRLSSSDPNLQNIPIRTDYGRRIREGFIAGRSDWALISADYSQIELRILAHLSQDAAMLEAFAGDADIHRDTAARVFGVTPEDVTSEMRRQAKAVNFGVVYGISAFGLARNLSISQGEAQRFIDAYFAQYPGVRAWLDGTIAEAKEQGYVKTILNRRRYLPELKSSDVNVRRGAERMAINTPVQGSAADIIKLAMVRLDKALDGTGARMLLQVHDELVVEAEAATAKDIAGTMKEIMESAAALDAPLKVDMGIGRNWAEIH